MIRRLPAEQLLFPRDVTRERFPFYQRGNINFKILSLIRTDSMVTLLVLAVRLREQVSPLKGTLSTFEKLTLNKAEYR